MSAPNRANAARGSKFSRAGKGARRQASRRARADAPDPLREIGPAANRRPLRGSGYMVRRRRDIIQMTTARTITTRMIHQ